MNIWQFISETGLSAQSSAESRRKALLINRIIFLTVALTLSFVPMMYFMSMRFYVPIQCTVGLLCFACLLFSKMQKWETAAAMMIIILGINLICCNTFYPGTGVAYFFFPLAAVPYIAFRRSPAFYFTLCWCFAGFIVAHFLGDMIKPVGIIEQPYLTIINFTVLFSALGILMVIMWILRAANERYEEMIIDESRKISEQKQIIEEKQKEILDSIRYAKRIQQALITSEKYIEKVLKK